MVTVKFEEDLSRFHIVPGSTSKCGDLQTPHATTLVFCAKSFFA